MAVLSKEDWAFWEENGYVVVPDAVPQENLDATVDAIWTFLEIDRDDREQWYGHKPYTREDYGSSPISAGGIVEIYQHQALWDNRQYPEVHQAFSEIWGTEKLWVSVDRACMKPPAREDNPEYSNKGFIHWDVDTANHPVPFGVQGVLYLTDTAEDQGGVPVRAGLSPDVRRMGQDATGGSPYAAARSAGVGGQTDCGPGGRFVDLASDAGARQWPQSIGQTADGPVYQHVAGGKRQREAAAADRGLA